MLLVVNYHYIGDENKYPYKGIYSVSAERLKNQLQELGRYFSFVGQAEVLAAAEGRGILAERSCLITFDDGLSDQYQNALPVLDALKIPTIFFVNGLPYDKNRVMVVHKIHWCRAHLEPRVFLEKVMSYYQKLMGQPLDLSKFQINAQELSRHYYYDTPDEARLKFVLDKGFVNQEVRERIVDAIFAELVTNEVAFAAQFYISPDQIRNLHARGYLGMHTYSHKALSLYSREICEHEINGCVAIVAKILGGSGKVFSLSYPYGNSEVVPPYITDIAKQAGLKLGFTMERSLNKNCANNSLLLARLDTNDAIGGKAPYFEMKDGAVTITNNKMHMFRSDIIKE